jgi:deazaflavin-dependent oxidoreductase (nitroreductase family)
MIVPDEFWTKIKNVQRIHQCLYGSGMGWVVGWIILLLEHTGRKSGLRHATPLQYEIINGSYYVGAARGTKADWYRNILANPQIRIKVGRRAFDGWAEPITDPRQVIAFLKYRFKRHPLMMGLMMKMHKLPMHPSEVQLEGLAKNLAIVILHPRETINEINIET